MPNIQELLKQIQRDLSCPVCGRKYEMGDIKVRGALDYILIIQTMCAEGHLTLFMTVFRAHKKIQIQPMTENDVLDLHNSLKDFKGDFEKQWNK